MADETMITRRRLLGLFGAAATLPALAACGSSIGGGTGQSGGQGGGTVRVGLVVPQSGVYAALGTDMQRGWQLWLDGNGNKFGDYTVETVVVDEGESPQTGVPAVQRVLQSDGVDVVVGLVNSATALGVRDLLTESRKLLVVTNAGAEGLTAANRTPYIWRTSFTNGQVAAAMGTHLAESGFSEGVYAIAPDYAAGTEVIAGFRRAFETGGGRVVGEAKLPRDHVGLPAVPHRDPGLRGARHVLLLLRRRGHHVRPAVHAVRAVLDDPAVRLRLPHRGERPRTTGRRRARRADDAALQRPARQPGQRGVRRGVHGCARGVTELLLRADLGRRERPEPGAAQYQRARRRRARHGPRRGGLDRRQPARAVDVREPDAAQDDVHLRRVEDVRGTLVNAVVQDLGQQSQPAA